MDNRIQTVDNRIQTVESQRSSSAHWVMFDGQTYIRDISVILKDSDPRLTKSLTMAKFNVAFAVFRDIICKVFPDRRKEVDAIISVLAMSYGGTLFFTNIT